VKEAKGRETRFRGREKPFLLLAGLALACARLFTAGDDLDRLDQLSTTEPKAAITLAETLLRTETDPRRRLRILNAQASSCIWTSDNDKAVALAGKAADIARRHGQANELGDALYIQATALHRLRRYSDAYDKAMLGLQAFEASGDREGQMKCTTRLGAVFGEIGDNRRALEHFARSLVLARELGDESLQADMIGSMTHVYFLEKDYARMLRSAQQAVSIYEKMGERRFIVIPLINAGIAHFKLGNLAEAETQLRRALAIARAGNEDTNEMIALKNLARVHREQGDLAAARDEARQSLEMALGQKDGLEAANVASELAEIHARMGNFQQAYRFQAQAIQAREDLQMKQVNERINRSLQQFEIEKKEGQIRLLRQRQEIDRLKMRQQRTVGWFLLVLAVVLFAAIVVTARAYLAKRRANREVNAMNARLEAMSRTDPLTQAMNRRGMLEMLQAEMGRFQRTRQTFAVAIGDIDDFKKINDSLGHECGDHALRLVAELMKSRLRRTDDLARWGGEEFLLLLPQTGRAGALEAVEQIRGAIAGRPLRWREREIALTMTFGVGVCGRGDSLDDLLDRVDQALYAGKRAGKNRVVGASPSPAGDKD